MLIFKTCVYNFLLLMGIVDLLLFDFTKFRRRFDLEILEITKEFLIKYEEIYCQNILLFSSTLR